MRHGQVPGGRNGPSALPTARRETKGSSQTATCSVAGLGSFDILNSGLKERTLDEVWQQQIRERAIAIWEREGRPAGDHDQFNAMAEQELVAEGQTPSSSPLDGHGNRDEAEVDEAIDEFVPGERPAGLDQRDRCRRAQRSQDTQAIVTSARPSFGFPHRRPTTAGSQIGSFSGTTGRRMGCDDSRTGLLVAATPTRRAAHGAA